MKQNEKQFRNQMKNINKIGTLFIGFSITACLFACSNSSQTTDKKDNSTKDSLQEYVAQRLPIYEKVRLSTNLNQLTVSERKVLP